MRAKRSLRTYNEPLIFGSIQNFIFPRAIFFRFSVGGWFGVGDGSARSLPLQPPPPPKTWRSTSLPRPPQRDTEPHGTMCGSLWGPAAIIAPPTSRRCSPSGSASAM